MSNQVEDFTVELEALRFATQAGLKLALHHRGALRNIGRLVSAVREECAALCTSPADADRIRRLIRCVCSNRTS